MTEKILNPRLEAVPPSSDILNEVATDISIEQIAHPETQLLIDELLAFSMGKQGSATKRTVVGLAAPQVGVGKRIIVVDVAGTGMGEEPDLRVYVNPVVTINSTNLESGREGCFSTGNVCGIVERASEVTIHAFDRHGEAVEETHHGFAARIFQHEIDHLDGIRFPDRISDAAKLHWVEPEQFGEYRKHWREWGVLCKRASWEAVKAQS